MNSIQTNERYSPLKQKQQFNNSLNKFNEINLILIIFSVFFFFFFSVGSQHSGAAEEEFSIKNELENSKVDLNNSIEPEPDRDSEGEERIEFQCPVCERHCQDLEQ